MPDPRGHVLIAGVATRALAGSAARAGYRVTAIDAFGDVDLRALASVVPLTRATGGFVPAAVADAARRIPAALVAYTSSLENHPDLVAELAMGRRLLGNPAEVLRAVRDPFALMRALAARGFPTPETRASAPPVAESPAAWLLKPRRSGGGHGTRPWRGDRAVYRGSYLQQRIRGTPGSIIFVADGRRAHPLGVTRQLVGNPAFGVRGFRYCGSLMGWCGARVLDREAELRDCALALAEAVTAEFGLVGLNGVDFIARRGVAWPIEVNPRPCASMELVERAGGPSLFQLHARACDGRLPTASERTAGKPLVLGKAVVFARRPVTARGLPGGLRGRTADIPHPGERIDRGHPICTVFGEARDAAECLRVLADRARTLYAALEARSARQGAA